MSIGDIFYQSALINALIFLWLASMVLNVRIFYNRLGKISTLTIFLSLLGPLFLAISWMIPAQHKVTLPKPHQQWIRSFMRSLGVTALVATLIWLLFYVLFVHNFYDAVNSNESILRSIGLYVVVAGFVGGLILSLGTRLVSFTEACFTTFFLSACCLSLKEWAEYTFSYGTSSTYFMTILLTACGLLLLFLTLGGAVGYLFFGEGVCNLRFGYESFIGIRFLMTKRTSNMVSIITVISIVAVMIACSGMIVVMSVMNGFSSDLRAKILGANAHLMVLKYGKDFTEYERVIEETKSLAGVVAVSAFVVNEGMVSSHKNLSGAIITGLDVARAKASDRLKYVDKKALHYLEHHQEIPVVHELGKHEQSDINELPGVILGKEMASDLQVMVGDAVNLISPVGEIGPTGPIPKAKAFRVCGLFNSGYYDFDAKFAYIGLADAQSFFNLGQSVTGVEYRVANIEDTRALAKNIDATIGGYPFYTRDWMQMNRNMFSALQLEKIAMLIILSTYIFMASLLILVTLIMVVMEKGKEIAILKSMGATDVSIMKIFVTYGLFVGTLGAIFGGVMGLLVCQFIEKIGIRLDPDVYYFSNLPVKFELVEVFLVVVTAILISFLENIPPSLFAARLKPVEGLRYE